MTVDSVQAGLALGAAIAFIALGYALVFSVLKFINFAHGDLVTLGAYLTLAGTNWLGFNIWVSGLVAATMTGLVGVALERLAFRPLREHRLSMFLSSFGVSMVINAALSLVAGSQSRPLVTLERNADRVFSAEVHAVMLATGVLVAVAAAFLLTRTNVGFALRAISENPQKGAQFGLPLDKLVSATFFASSFLGAVGGVFLGIWYSVSPQMGYRYGVWAFAVVVVAGFGSIGGIVLVGLAAGLIFTRATGALGSQELAASLLFLLMTVMLLVRPAGLFGRQLRRF